MQRHNAGDPHDPDHQHKVAMNANMSTLEQDIKKQILGRSKAEKVFRPWWDTVEDYLLNCLVLLGKQSLYSLHWGHPYTSDHVGGRVQTTWTEFWAFLTPPPPYVDTFTK